MKVALVGMGPIGSMHVDNITAGKIPDCELVAVCDTRKIENPKLEGKKIYSDIDALLADKDVESVIISTPSFTHFDLACKVLNAGKNVLVEKPMALCTADILKIDALAKEKKLTAAVMLNQRTNPMYARIRQLVKDGELGNINRVSWNMTNWYRPDVYYKCNTWRGTFKGEAGGVLINQGIHNIDAFAWIFGLPQTLRAWCKFGKYHDIEVEDEVSAFMEYPENMTATFITSSGEHPGTNRFEISGDKGYIVAEDGKLLKKYMFKDTTLSDYTKNTKYVFGTPETEYSQEEFSDKGLQHVGVLRNFVNSINGKEELLYSPAQGYLSVCLANAMLLSTWTNSDINFPFNDAAYAALLAEKTANSKLRTETVKDCIMDFGKSFR